MSITGCTDVAPVAGTVVFDPAVFIQLYPSFATVPTQALQFNFNQATLILGNSCGSRVCDAVQREMLLGLLTAHITAILNGVNGQGPSGIVGRISSAAEGTVNVATEFGALTTNQSVAYLQQTPWGVQFLAATAVYRTATYVPPPMQPCGVIGVYGGPVGGYGGYWQGGGCY